MPNNLPIFLDKHKICIICEGNEEYAYLDRLKKLQVWNSQYEVLLDNAGGNGNIPAKPVNAPLIQELTGVANYKGRADQLRSVMEYITVENYSDMCQRVKQLDIMDTITGSSNFGRFMEYLGNSGCKWMEKINENLEF